MELSLVFIISAFIAGLLMFLAPCTLPLVPAYLAFISGVSEADTVAGGKSRTAHKRLVINAVAFVVGFSLVFILFGVAAGAVGAQIGQYRTLLSQIGGVFVVIFGLMLLGFLTPTFLTAERRVPIPKWIHPGNPVSSLLIGAIFALGWTPCVGPVLASVLFLATTTATIKTGAFMLCVFSLGLAVPFIATAFLYASLQSRLLMMTTLSVFISKVGGAFLLLLGVLLLTDSFALLVLYGNKFFNFLHLESLYNYY